MKEVKTEKVKASLGDILQKYSKDEIATICSEISAKVCNKADELGQLFKALKDSYPEIFCLVDFSLICTFTADAFPTGDAPFLCMLGTKNGISNAAQGIIQSLKEIANDEATA